MEKGKGNFLFRAWNGEVRLWKVWWLLGIPLNIVAAVFRVWSKGAMVNETPITALMFLVGVVVILVAYIAWCNMAWSCAKNVDNAVWTTIVKIVIVLGLVRTALEFINGVQP